MGCLYMIYSHHYLRELFEPIFFKFSLKTIVIEKKKNVVPFLDVMLIRATFQIFFSKILLQSDWLRAVVFQLNLK